MRNLKNVVSTGCFFLCLGGWVYSGPANAADQVTQARETALNTAVAQAVTPEAPIVRDIQLAQAAPAAATEPAPELTKSVVNVGVDGRIDQFSMQDTDIVSVLHVLSLQTKRNIIASKDVKGSVSANLYNVTFNEALTAILQPNGFDYIEKGNFIFVYTAAEIKLIRERDRKAVRRVFKLKYITSTDAEVMLKPMMSSTGILAKSSAGTTGLSSGMGDSGGEAYTTDGIIVVSDYPENLDEISNALLQIDVRPKQVLIEATVLNATLHDENALGIDLISLSGVDFSSLTGGGFSTGGGSSSSTGGTGGSGGTGGTTGTPVNGPSSIANTFLGAQNEFHTNTDFGGGVPSGGLSVGFMSNHIAVFMRALETVSDVTVVTNPKILTLNRMKGYVHIGQKLGYQTTSTNQTSTQQTVQFLDVGTTLIFRPFISDDGHIRMEIHPEDSSGIIDSKGVPQTNTTEVTSNIMIPDGRTVVIGGLFSESTTASKSQVPILGNIPVLGPAFRRTDDTGIRQETIVMVTPHIINDDSSIYDETRREQEDIQRMQLGNRAGMQPWGRDRIAHMWYALAQDELSKGDTEKALMFADWALNTNPRMLEAIKLREELSHTKMDEKSGSSVADLVKNVLKGDAAMIPDHGSSGNYPPAPAPADKK